MREKMENIQFSNRCLDRRVPDENGDNNVQLGYRLYDKHVDAESRTLFSIPHLRLKPKLGVREVEVRSVHIAKHSRGHLASPRLACDNLLKYNVNKLVYWFCNFH